MSSAARVSALFRFVANTWSAKRLQAEPLLRTVLQTSASLAQVIEYVNDLQHRVNDALQVVRSMPLAVHHQFTAQAFTPGQQLQFAHKLGRAWLGVIVLSDQGAVWNGSATHIDATTDARFVTITAGSNGGLFSILVW